MRKFLVSSANFTGNAELVYDESGTLRVIDISDTSMPAGMVKGFKAFVPEKISDLENAFAKTKVTVIETGFVVTFDMFWVAYKKKINKARCIELWNKLNKTNQVAAFMEIKRYDSFLKRESWRQKADPETYLRNQYWENDYEL